VLLDWQMPVMDGLECARLLARRAPSRLTPAVLMITAFSRDEVLRRLDHEQLTVSAMLAKPVTPSALFDACLAALGLESFRPTRSARREEALIGAGPAGRRTHPGGGQRHQPGTRRRPAGPRRHRRQRRR
jgi:DNA-binding NarL/FixJ family response regulator